MAGRAFIKIFLILIFLTALISENIFAAVESIGEVNAKDNSTGTVLAGFSADLILSIIIDMSQAEPGEEIESIQISVPNGLSVKPKTVKSVAVGGRVIPNFTESVPDKNFIMITLPNLITLTSTVSIEFTVDVSSIPIPQLTFVVGLIAINQRLLIASIKPGNSDGRVNNDSLTIKSVLATKPLAPYDLKAEPDPDGENDIILSWNSPEDVGISGYLIYRSDKGDEPIANISSAFQNDYVDRDLKPGKYSYTVRSYKTETLRSDPSNTVSAVANPDTKAPLPPSLHPELKVVEKGIEITWDPSLSKDVVKYLIYRGASINSLNLIDEVSQKNSYIDNNPPESGSYLYVVSAVDEAGNETKSSPTQIRKAISGDKPQPNPFTPLSSDSRYNQVTFPITIVKGGEGTFAIKIYDLEGNLVFEKTAEEGIKEIRWNGKDMNDKYVNSGVYIYQASVGDKYKIGSIIVAK